MAINLSNKETVAKANELTYEVLEECGTLDTKEYQKKGEDVTEELKLRYLKWNKGEARYDLRWWITTSEGERCGKGVGMSGEALITLGKLIKEMQKDPIPKACRAKANPTVTQKVGRTKTKTTTKKGAKK